MANDKKPKLFLGQNMSTRVRSPLFWTGVVGIIGSAVVSFGGLIGLDLSDKVGEVTANSSQIIEFVFLILGLIGVTNDPTSKNYRDTGMAQTYTKPRDENVDPVEYQKKGYEPEQWNDDFAEEVEIEEGLRDVEDDEVIVDNFDSDINNSGVMLDTSQQVEGAIENDENTITDK